jgi:glycosyltransferase involved in cell wall biosynthesis
MQDNVGAAGLLIPPQDEAALTQAIATLLSDQPLRERLSLAGRQRAAEFTWERTAEQTLKVYEHVGAQS